MNRGPPDLQPDALTSAPSCQANDLHFAPSCHYNDLHDALCNKDVNSFWKTWNSKLNTKSTKPKIFGGLADPAEISEGFAAYFSNTCKPNNVAKHDQFRNEYVNKSVNCSSDYLHANDFFTVELISIIVSNLKTRKAAG